MKNCFVQTLVLGGLIGLCGFTPFSGRSQNLLQNGDFSNGLTSWSTQLIARFDTGNAVMLLTNNPDPYARTYNGYAGFGASLSSSTESVSQTVATSIGISYEISFYAQTAAGYKTSDWLNFGSLSVNLSPTLGTDGTWKQFDFVTTATAAQTILSFQHSTDLGAALYLSNVSVTALTVTPTPEPSSLALLALGAAGLGGWHWRRRSINR